MARVDNRRKAEIVLVCGGSGSGKSVWVKRRIRKEPRVLVFDVKREYGGTGTGFHTVTRQRELIACLKRAGSGRGRYAYVGARAHFDWFCRAAFAWGDCVVVAEELASYTSPGKAPEGWHICISQGRALGVRPIGITQRPSESDKTIIGNATLVHCGKMKRAGDRQYMAREMDIPQHYLDDLKPLEWIETGDGFEGIRKGKITF